MLIDTLYYRSLLVFTYPHTKNPFSMASNFNPALDEWIALGLAVTVAHHTGKNLADVAIASGWKLWWHDKKAVKPWLVPELYAFARYFQSLFLAFGWWLAWREAFRSQLDPSSTDEGVSTPSNHYVFMFNLFYIIIVFLSQSFGYTFFIIGLEWGFMMIPLLTEICIWVSVGVLAVYVGLIWYVPAILVAISLAFYTFSVGVMFDFAMKHDNSTVNGNYIFKGLRDTIGSREGSKAGKKSKAIQEELDLMSTVEPLSAAKTPRSAKFSNS